MNYSHEGRTSYGVYPHAWIGIRLWDTPGFERSALVFATREATGGTGPTLERMCVTPAGNVGIGTSTPGFMLQVDEATAAGYAVSIRNSNDNLQLKLGTTTGSLLNIQGSTISADAAYNISLQADGGCVGIGTTTPSYTLEVNGSFGATSKSFIIDHPTKPDKKLQYGSLEGPEHSVYLRGRSKYKVIDLPDYWPELVHEDSITVQLTSVGKHQSLYVEKIENNKVYINSNKVGEILNYFYNIYAERKDVAKLEVEIDKE